MSVTFTVPDKITASFVVTADCDPGDLPVRVRQGLTGPFAKAAAERIGTPRLQVTGYPAADSPWDLAAFVDAEPDEAPAIGNARRHIGVTATLKGPDLPFGLQVARSVTRAIAASVSGVPVDLDTGRTLPTSRANDGEPARFALADDWLGAWLPPSRDGGPCTADEDEINGCTCMELSTRGLRRFGLPELRIGGVACAHDLAAVNILRTTAQRLLPLGTRPGEHTLSPGLPLTSTDFSAYWGGREVMWEDGPVPVDLTRLEPDVLGVGPPADFSDTLNDWLWDELPPVLYELLSYEPCPP